MFQGERQSSSLAWRLGRILCTTYLSYSRPTLPLHLPLVLQNKQLPLRASALRTVGATIRFTTRHSSSLLPSARREERPTELTRPNTLEYT